MKMRITVEDIKQLNETQKRWLMELWKPQKYDVAVASICMDVENEIYDEFEFVVGRIALDKHANIYIHDITHTPSDSTEDIDESDTGASDQQSSTGLFKTAVKNLEIPFANSPDSPQNDEASDEEDYYEDDGETEDGFEMEYTRPGFFNKEDCIPLLNIGQIIELLQRFDYGNGDFYLIASTGEVGCEMGKNASTWEDYRNYESRELCDVLWELLKAALE